MERPHADLMSIGAFSRRTGLTPKALRLYDSLELLLPAVVDFSSGYRYYREEQIEEAIRIGILRQASMPLEEIRALLHEHEPAAADVVLARHRGRLEGQIHDLERALASLPCGETWCRERQEDGTMKTDAKTYVCSFCAKDRHAVQRMISGPGGVIICNECVDLCNKIIAAETQSEASGKTEGDNAANRG